MDQSPSYKWVVLIVSTISSFLTPFMGSAITIALPPIAKEFGADAVTQSWIVTSFLLAAGIFLVPFGRVADIYGRKKIYLSGVIIFTIASLFCALATSNPILILFRIIQGLGNAMVFATGMAILISVFPPRNRGKVIGINIAATYIGLSSGPILGGILTEAFTWRSVFWINVPLGLIIIALVSICLKGDWAEAQGDKFDLTGACFYGASILGLMLGIATLPGLKGVGLTCLGMVFMGLFIYRESRIAFPVFDLNLFKTNKVFAFSNLAALINYSATFALSFWLSLYFQNLKGLTPTQTGLILLSQPVIMALFSPLAGLLSDRKEPRLLATLGMIITTLGLLLFAFLKMDTPPAFVVANLILIGFGFALFSSPNTNAVMSCIEKRHYSIASGSLGTMRLLGMTISMGISTMILSIYLGSVQITPEYFATFIKGIRAAFMIFSLLCFGGIFASGIRGKMHNGADEAPLTDAPRV